MPGGFPLQDTGPGMNELFHDLTVEQEQERADRRDKIARIIDEHSVDTVKMHGRQNASRHAVEGSDIAFAKADAILALS